MPKEYVPIFFDWLDVTQDLTPEEKANLIDAVVSYASGKPYEHLLTGGCKIAFRFMKGQVDRNSALSDARSKAASKKQDETNDSKNEQNETNENKTEQTEANFPKEKENKKQEQEQKTKTNESASARAQESLIASRFEIFWNEYPRKTDKKKALEAFRKIDPDQALLGTMLESLSQWKKTAQWQEEAGRYIPHPTTWLRNRRWEDEVPAARAAPAATMPAQGYEQRDYSGPGESMDDALSRIEQMQRMRREGAGA